VQHVEAQAAAEARHLKRKVQCLGPLAPLAGRLPVTTNAAVRSMADV
jgi:hypothetical protein